MAGQWYAFYHNGFNSWHTIYAALGFEFFRERIVFHSCSADGGHCFEALIEFVHLEPHELERARMQPKLHYLRCMANGFPSDYITILKLAERVARSLQKNLPTLRSGNLAIIFPPVLAHIQRLENVISSSMIMS